MPGQIVGITGHRPDKLGGWNPCPEWDLVHHNIRNTLIALQPKVVLSGMALGVDQWTAEICIQLGIPFVAFVPYPDHGSNWPAKARLKYDWLLRQAHQVVIIVPEPGYAPWKLHQRNRWLVDQCELLAAVYNGSEGGTQKCLTYAMSVKRAIHYIPIGVLVPVETALAPATPTLETPATPTLESLFSGHRPQQAQQPQRQEPEIRPKVTRIIEE